MKQALFVLLLAAVGTGAYFGGRYQAARGAAGGETKPAERKILYWYDPMHPSYKSDKPGIAPDCGMRLEPMYEDGAGAGGAQDLPPGVLEVSPERQQLIGVRYGEVEMASAGEEIRTVGQVEMDETRTTRVQARYEGFIDKVMADFTGRQVKAGEPMLTIYSPELVASQREYLLALKSRELLRHSTLPDVAHDNRLLIEAARRRLEHFRMAPEEVAELERTGKPLGKVTVFAPASGVITERKAFPNQKATPEMELYTLVDLSRVWIMAAVFESDAPLVRVGQAARIALTSQPGRVLRARVSYILPQVDPKTRTLQVRLEADNPALLLKPGMFVEVALESRTGPRLMAPSEAVLDSGLRKTVFVDLGEGKLEARQVETGRQYGDRVEILSGLRAGERIVVSGNFLLDSESQLKAAVSGMGAGGHQHGAAPAAATEEDHSQHQHEGHAPGSKPAATPKPAAPPAAEDHSHHRHEGHAPAAKPAAKPAPKPAATPKPATPPAAEDHSHHQHEGHAPAAKPAAKPAPKPTTTLKPAAPGAGDHSLHQHEGHVPATKPAAPPAAEDHSHHQHEGHAPTSKPAATPKPAAPPAAEDHSHHQHEGHAPAAKPAAKPAPRPAATPKPAAPPAAEDHSHHQLEGHTPVAAPAPKPAAKPAPKPTPKAADPHEGHHHD